MFAIYKREFKAFYQSATGYVFMGIFLFVGGLFFMGSNIGAASASIGTLLSNLEFLFMIIVPLLTMKVFSDERRSKTDQLLMTSPVSLWSIVVGKFMAACTVFLFTLIISSVYVIIIEIFGAPAYGEVFAGYLGFFLLGCGFIAIGTFISSLTENQVTSAILTFGAILTVYFSGYIANIIGSDILPFLPAVVNSINIYSRFNNFGYGVISLADLVYMLSFTGVFLFLTVRGIERRRWSEG